MPGYKFSTMIPFSRAATSTLRRRLKNLDDAAKSEIFRIANREIATTELNNERLKSLIDTAVRLQQAGLTISSQDGDPYHAAALISWVIASYGQIETWGFEAHGNTPSDTQDGAYFQCSKSQFKHTPVGRTEPE